MKNFWYRLKHSVQKIGVVLRQKVRAVSAFASVQKRRTGYYLRTMLLPRLKHRLKQFGVYVGKRYQQRRPVVLGVLKLLTKTILVTAGIYYLLRNQKEVEFLVSAKWWLLGGLGTLVLILTVVTLRKKGKFRKLSLPSFSWSFPWRKLVWGVVLAAVVFFFIDPLTHLVHGIWSIRPTDENMARWNEEARAKEEAQKQARKTDFPCTYDLSEYGTGKHLANHDAKFLKPDDREAWKVCFFDRLKPNSLSNEQLEREWKDRFPTLSGDTADWDVIVIRNRQSGTRACLLRDKQNNGYQRTQFPWEEGGVEFEMYDVSRHIFTGGDSKNVFKINC